MLKMISFDLTINYLLKTIIALLFLYCNINNKYKKTKLSYFIFIIIFLLLQIISIITTNEDISYLFLTGLLEKTYWSAAFTTYFFKTILLLILYFSVAYCLRFILNNIMITNDYSTTEIGISYYLVKIYKLKLLEIIYQTKKVYIYFNKYIKLCLVLYSIGFLCGSHSLLYRTFYSLYTNLSLTSSNRHYTQIFEELTSSKYILKNQIEASFIDKKIKPKNLVIIILEAVEQGMITNPYFRDFTPNLNKLFNDKHNNIYKNIYQIEGSGSTIQGIHTMFTGYPALYSLNRSMDDIDIDYTKRVSIFNILNKLKYYKVYLQGAKKHFANTDLFFKYADFEEIYGRNELMSELNLKEEDLADWGIADYDLFEYAKSKYKMLVEQKEPFVLVFENIDTHNNSGVSKVCLEKYKNYDRQLATIKCLDDYIADFLSYIKTLPNYKDTLIVILPDHLNQSKIARLLDNKNIARKLFTIFINDNLKSKDSLNDVIIYPDLPRIILDKMGIQTNYKFLTDHIYKDKDSYKIQFLLNHRNDIREFNDKISGN